MVEAINKRTKKKKR